MQACRSLYLTDAFSKHTVFLKGNITTSVLSKCQTTCVQLDQNSTVTTLSTSCFFFFLNINAELTRLWGCGVKGDNIYSIYATYIFFVRPHLGCAGSFTGQFL